MRLADLEVLLEVRLIWFEYIMIRIALDMMTRFSKHRLRAFSTLKGHGGSWGFECVFEIISWQTSPGIIYFNASWSRPRRLMEDLGALICKGTQNHDFRTSFVYFSPPPPPFTDVFSSSRRLWLLLENSHLGLWVMWNTGRIRCVESGLFFRWNLMNDWKFKSRTLKR